MTLVKDKVIKHTLEKMIGWTFINSSIKKVYTFDSYMSSIKFINHLAAESEEENHHPDMAVGWCQIEIVFTSHDQGGVTAACLEMAKKTDTIYLKKLELS